MSKYRHRYAAGSEAFDDSSSLLRLALTVRARHVNESQRKGVLSVASIGYIFQVAQAVIQLIAVFMIRYMPFGKRPQEGGSDQAVNLVIAAVGSHSVRQGYFPITSFPDFRYQKDAPAFRYSRIVDAFNSTKARNQIASFFADHSSPFFGLKFFGGKLRNRHGVNLHRQVSLCLGSFAVQPAFEPLLF